MAKKFRHHTREFKVEAVRLLKESGKPVSRLADELGIDHSTLARWREELDPGRGAEDGGADSSEILSKDEQIKRLRREMQVLKEERDFLKKAAAFFAKESR
jgi:transposase